jgi:hypothetical protein
MSLLYPSSREDKTVFYFVSSKWKSPRSFPGSFRNNEIVIFGTGNVAQYVRGSRFNSHYKRKQQQQKPLIYNRGHSFEPLQN